MPFRSVISLLMLLSAGSLTGKEVIHWTSHHEGLCNQLLLDRMVVSSADTSHLIDGHKYAVSIRMCNALAICSLPLRRDIYYYRQVPRPGVLCDLATAKGPLLDAAFSFNRTFLFGQITPGPIVETSYRARITLKSHNCDWSHWQTDTSFIVPVTLCNILEVKAGDRASLEVEVANHVGSVMASTDGVIMTENPSAILNLEIKDIHYTCGSDASCSDTNFSHATSVAAASWSNVGLIPQVQRVFLSVHDSLTHVAVSETMMVGTHEEPYVYFHHLHLLRNRHYYIQASACNSDYCLSPVSSDGFVVIHRRADAWNISVTQARFQIVNYTEGLWTQPDGSDYTVSERQILPLQL